LDQAGFDAYYNYIKPHQATTAENQAAFHETVHTQLQKHSWTYYLLRQPDLALRYR
jgi:hypothetical protein